MTEQRVRWIDDAKGYAIVLVVLAHVWRGLRDAHLLAWGKELAYLDHAIYSFHMPLFFLLSGITAYISDARSGGKARDVLRLYYIYLFWSLIQTSLMFGLSGITTGEVSVQKLVLIPLSPSAQFWFLLVLIVFRLLTHVVARPLLLPAALCAFLVGAILTPNTLGFNVYHFSLFFVLGYRDISKIAGYMTTKVCSVLAGVTAIFLIVSTYLIYDAGFAYDSLAAVGSAIYGSMLVLCVARALANTRLGALFNMLGRYSIHIYILHIIAASGIRVICVKAGLITDGYWLLVVCTVGGLMFPIIAFHLARKLGLEALFTMKWKRGSQATSTRGAAPQA